MGNCWLAVVGRSYPGVGYGLAKVQKRKRRLADLQGVFERRMISGPKSIKFSRSCRAPEDAPSTSSSHYSQRRDKHSLGLFSFPWLRPQPAGGVYCQTQVENKFSQSNEWVCWWLLQRTQIEVVLQSLQAIIVWDHYGVEGLNVHS